MPRTLVFRTAASVCGVSTACLAFHARERRPRVVHASESLAAKVVLECGAGEGYRPAWWLPGGHLDTLYAHYRLNLFPPPFPCLREELRGDDGGVFSIDFDAEAQDLPGTAPLVFFLPTLTGCSRQGWGVAAACRRAGMRYVALDRRGHVQSLSTPRFSLAGSVPDLRIAIEHCSKRYPEASIGLIGSSMGSALLVRYLGDEAGALPSAIVGAVGIGFGFEAGVAMSRVTGLYNVALSKKLKSYFIEPNLEILQAAHPSALRRCLSAESVHEFCVAHSPFAGHGIEGGDGGLTCGDFHRRSNPVDVLPNVNIPLLLVTSENDPIVSSRNVKENEDLIESHPNAVLVHSPTGGHVGFHYTSDGETRSWADDLAVRFLHRLASEAA